MVDAFPSTPKNLIPLFLNFGELMICGGGWVGGPRPFRGSWKKQIKTRTNTFSSAPVNTFVRVFIWFFSTIRGMVWDHPPAHPHKTLILQNSGITGLNFWVWKEGRRPPPPPPTPPFHTPENINLLMFWIVAAVSSNCFFVFVFCFFVVFFL